jgi:hypothetical protein
MVGCGIYENRGKCKEEERSGAWEEEPKKHPVTLCGR